MAPTIESDGTDSRSTVKATGAADAAGTVGVAPTPQDTIGTTSRRIKRDLYIEGLCLRRLPDNSKQ